MIPLSIDARSYRTFEELHIDLPEGALAITGPMGSGKSSIVEAIELALYGSCRTGALVDNLGIGLGDRLEITLTFEHAGDTFRARRGYSAAGRGKPTLDFETTTAYDEVWHPLTRESIRATQVAIEELIGLSHDSFRASCFIAQKDASAFTNATPSDAKAILGEVMRLGSWDRLRDLNREQKRSSEREITELAGRIALLEESAGSDHELEFTAATIASSVPAAELAHGDAEKKLTAAAESVQALEQSEAMYRVRESAVRTAEALLRERQAVIDRATAAKLEAVSVQRWLDQTGDPSAEVAKLEEKRAAMDTARELRREREVLRDRYIADREDARRQGLSVESERANVEKALKVLLRNAETLAAGTCDRCGQEVHGEAFQQARARLRAERDEAEVRIKSYSARIAEHAAHEQAHKDAAAAVVIPDAPGVDEYDEVTFAIRRLREAEIGVAQMREKLAGMQAQIAEVTPELKAEVDGLSLALVEAQEALAAIDEPEPGALDAQKVAAVTRKAELDIVAHKLIESRAALVRAESALEAAQKIALDLGNCRQKQAEIQGELDLLALLERAYGRDGVPVHLVETLAIPAIETEANRILAAFGESNRVELRTQAERKSGDGLKDGLWIVVQTPEGERGHRTFSGGEGACLDFALRVGLARLLRHRGGADISFLVVDEIEGLDEVHQAAFVEIVLGLRDEFSKIMISSHYSGLRDAPLDALIEVVNEDGRSRIVGDREPVLA